MRQQPPKFVWDDQAQAGYLYIKHDIGPGEVVRTQPADSVERVLLDFDEKGQVVGVEVLSCFQVEPPPG